jgi:acetamidase/formamidase
MMKGAVRLAGATVLASITSGHTVFAWDAPEAHLASTPVTVAREISNARPPVLRIKSGQTVLIDTVAQLHGTEDAVSFYGAHGIPANEVLQDSIAIGKMPRPPGGGHILTGPIYIDGAEPGDLLEVQIIKITPRSPYGVNTPGPDGAAPDVVLQRLIKVIKLDLKRNVALLADNVEVPLAPFLGIMAVAPGPDVGGTVATGPPGPFGGNMDLRRLVDGSTLYLPVFNSGALFYAGDSHAGQGDGEVDGTAIEASMSATLRFIVHKGAGKGVRFPLAEDKDNFFILGMNKDLNLALRSAVEETIAFLGRRTTLSPTESYVLASTAVNFTVGEAVDDNLIVYGVLPKKIFTTPISVVSGR